MPIICVGTKVSGSVGKQNKGGKLSSCRKRERLVNGIVVSSVIGDDGRFVVWWKDNGFFGIYSFFRLKNHGPSHLSHEEIEVFRTQYFSNKDDIAMMQRKQILIDHLTNETFVEVRNSPIHGIGVFAITKVPKGIDPFKTNGKVTDEIVDLSEEEVNSLPQHVQNKIKKFIVPHIRENGVINRTPTRWYGIPEAGLNCLDVSWYMNSGRGRRIEHGRQQHVREREIELEIEREFERQRERQRERQHGGHERPNLGFDITTDNRGMARIFLSRDIEKKEELLGDYEFLPEGYSTNMKQENNGDDDSQSDHQRSDSNLPAIEDATIPDVIGSGRRQNPRAAVAVAAAPTPIRQPRPWRKNTKVLIWFPEDKVWVDGKVMEFVSVEKRKRNDRKNGVADCNIPFYKRGKYKISWSFLDDPTSNDDDYFSEGDATVERSCSQSSRLQR